jgi:hypothetical protein
MNNTELEDEICRKVVLSPYTCLYTRLLDKAGGISLGKETSPGAETIIGVAQEVLKEADHLAAVWPFKTK